MSQKAITHHDYIFAPTRTRLQKLMIWAHTHKEQLREGVKLAVLVVVALAAMKGLVLLGLVFQFLLPLSTIAAAILAIVQIS